MIGEEAFKGFCRHAESGLPIRALFITPTAIARREQRIDMINEAGAHGLDIIVFDQGQKLEIGPAVAYQRIAHPYLDRELKGLEWHFIHGLEYLDAFEHGEAIALNLTATARL